MKPAKELSAQLQARLGPPANTSTAAGDDSRRGGSDYSKLRGIIRTQKDQITALENEVAHFQTRMHRIEDGHRLELSRLKKEVEYHKRLRQGADHRSYELEDQLSRLQLQQGVARQRNHDEEKDGLIVSQLALVSKNSELTTRNQQLEAQLAQLEELKAALENGLNQAYCERDELAEQLERFITSQHYYRAHAPAEDEEQEGEDEEASEVNGGLGGSSGDVAALDAAATGAAAAAWSQEQDQPQEPGPPRVKEEPQ